MFSFAPSVAKEQRSDNSSQLINLVNQTKTGYETLSKWLYDDSMDASKQARLEKYKIAGDARDEAYKIAGEERAEAGLMDETRPQGMEFKSKMDKRNLEMQEIQKKINAKSPPKLSDRDKKLWDSYDEKIKMWIENMPDPDSEEYPAWLDRFNKLEDEQMRIGMSRKDRLSILQQRQKEAEQRRLQQDAFKQADKAREEKRIAAQTKARGSSQSTDYGTDIAP